MAYELDIALVEGRMYDDALQVIPWLKDEMHIIASASKPLTPKLHTKYQAQQTIENLDLNHQKWVLREANSGTREQFDQLLAPHIPHWSIGLEFNSNEAVINAVAAGVGLGFMSNLSAADAFRNKRLISLPRQEVSSRQLYLVCLKERYISPLLQAFINYSLNWVAPNLEAKTDNLYDN